MPLRPQHDWYYEEIAETIGGDISVSEVKNLISTADRNGILFHGLSREDQYAAILAEGIQPKMYEQEVEWQEATTAFGSIENDDLVTEGSVFFDTGHTYDPTRKKSTMMIALTTYDRLNHLGVCYRNNADGCSTSDTPTRAVHMVRVSEPGLYAESSTAAPPGMGIQKNRFAPAQSAAITDAYMPAVRDVAQQTEQKMFRSLMKVIQSDMQF